MLAAYGCTLDTQAKKADSVTQHTLLVVPQPDRRETQQFAVSMYDLRAHLK